MKKRVRRWLDEKWRSKMTEKRPRSVPTGTRVYAIGDIHGRIDLLDSLLKRIDEHLSNSPIEHSIQVFLGDYIDRGPASREVIQRLIERSLRHKIVCLKGNHEAFLMKFLEEPVSFDDWRQWGGLPTLMSYGLKPPRRIEPAGDEEIAIALRQVMPLEHQKFLAKLPVTFVCGDYFFVHAGVRPGVPLTAQKEDDLIWIRDEFLNATTNFGKMIVHGHTPVEEVDIRKNRINIDTGAYASGKLTCLVLEGEKLFFI